MVKLPFKVRVAEPPSNEEDASIIRLPTGWAGVISRETVEPAVMVTVPGIAVWPGYSVGVAHVAGETEVQISHVESVLQLPPGATAR